MKKMFLFICLLNGQTLLSMSIPSTTAPEQDLIHEQKMALVFGAKGLNVGVNTLDFIIALEKKLHVSSPLIQKKAQQYAAHILQHDVYQKEFTSEISYLKSSSNISSTIFSHQDKALGSAIVHYIKEVHKKIKSATREQINAFLKQLQHNSLPQPLNAWGPDNVFYHHESKVKAQNMLVEMAIMLGTQFAVEAANQWVDSQDSVCWTVLSQASSNIQSDFSTFQNLIQSYIQGLLTTTINLFTSAQSKLESETEQANITSQTEIDYLSKMVDLDLPKGEYLVATTTMSGATYDALFEVSKMFTPSGITWRNVRQIGDWEFEPTTKSFWQFSLVDTVTTNSISSSSNNYIFTEFYSNQASYNIECDITLYKVSYPFFSGVLFNNNRWISGSMSGFRRYRMVGIYGKSENEIGVYYAEQVDPTVAPLDIVLSGTATKLGDVSNGNKITEEDGLTYSFNITNTSEKITITFGEAGETISSASITSKDPTMFIYHGVGFISPGAIAQYKLKQPETILFTSDAINDFQKEISALSSAPTITA